MPKSLNIEIDLGAGDTRAELHRINQEMYAMKTGGKDMTTQIDLAGRQMEHFAKVSGVTNEQMTKMILTARKDIRLDSEMKSAAVAAGLTQKELSLVNRQVEQLKNNSDEVGNKFGKLGTLMKAAGAYFGVTMLKSFSDKVITESNQTENALIGFKTVVKNTLGDGMQDAAISAAQRLKQSLGGAMDEGSIQMSIKNLLNTGFSLDQAVGLIEKNAYMASVNRQSQYANIAEAVVTYTEGIKNNNAMLTDSTGISENLSVTLKKQGLSMDMLNNEATKGAVIQAIYNSHVKEASQYQDAFSKQMEGFQGQQARISVGMKTMLSNIGDLVKKGWSPLYAIVGNVLDYFNAGEKGIARLKTALLFLGSVAIVSLIAYTYKWIAVNGKAAIATIIAWAPVILTIAAIAAGLTALYLIYDDIVNWMAGNDSLIGSWLGDFDTLLPRFKNKIKTIMSDIWSWLKNGFKGIVADVKGFFIGIWDGVTDKFYSVMEPVFRFYNNKIVPIASKFGWDLQPVQIEARAAGGDVEPNRPYLVGEKGPELKTFKTGGTIIPNHKLGGKSAQVNITIHVDARGGSAQNGRSIAEEVKKAFTSAIPAIRAQLGLEVSPA